MQAKASSFSFVESLNEVKVKILLFINQGGRRPRLWVIGGHGLCIYVTKFGAKCWQKGRVRRLPKKVWINNVHGLRCVKIVSMDVLCPPRVTDFHCNQIIKPTLNLTSTEPAESSAF